MSKNISLGQIGSVGIAVSVINYHFILVLVSDTYRYKVLQNFMPSVRLFHFYKDHWRTIAFHYCFDIIFTIVGRESVLMLIGQKGFSEW